MRADSIAPPARKSNGCVVLFGRFPGGHRYPLWLWWNLLSLDAPTIVCLWALLFLHSLRIPFRSWEVAALVCAVWVIYAGDRILDGLRRPPSTDLPERHIFYSQHVHTILAILIPAVLATGWIGLERLGTEARFAGILMSFAVALYFLAIHGVPARAAGWFPKEIVAGAIFAMGAALPAWMHGAEGRRLLLPEAMLFGGLCVLNCVAIECWEHNRGDRRWADSPYWLIRVADARIMPLAATLFLGSALAAAFVLQRGGAAYLPGSCAISLLGMMAIERHSHSLSRQALRVLADAALLTPLLFLLRLVL